MPGLIWYFKFIEACKTGDLKQVKFLSEKINPNSKDAECLHVAMVHKQLEVFKFLLRETEVDLNINDGDILRWAVRLNLEENVDLILESEKLNLNSLLKTLETSSSIQNVKLLEKLINNINKRMQKIA